MNAAAEHHEVVLSVDSLDVSINPFGAGRVQTVRDASLMLRRGEVVGLVGESGSGKTMLTRAVAGLLAPGLRPEVSGSVKLMSRELVGADTGARRQALRTDLSYVFQDPNAHLNPTMRVGEQIAEAIVDGTRSVFELLESVGLPGTSDFSRLYPHQLSGGMKQRVIIACALAKNPGLIIADEPTTALDVTIQDQVLRLLKRLAHEEDVAVLLVSHDLAAIGQVCSRMYVMYQGDLVENGATEDILWRPQHDYTRSLMRAMRAIYDAPIAAEGER